MRVRIVRLLMALCLIGSPWLTSRPIGPLGLIEQSDAASVRPMDLGRPIALHPPRRLLSAGTLQTITVEVEPNTLIAHSAATALITATVVDDTGAVMPDVNLSGVISPTELGTLSSWDLTDSSGQITGTWTAGTQIGLGTLEIVSGTVSGTASIALTAGALTTITVAPNFITVTAAATTTFSATGTDVYSNVVSITPTWTTNGGSIDAATGVFTAPIMVTNGIVITATDGTISGTAMANIVAESLNSIVITPSAAPVVAGTVFTFTAAGLDQHNNSVPITPIWTTNGGSINAATGVFTAPTAVTNGIVITATDGAISGTAMANIVAGAPFTVTLNASSPSQTVGASSALTATVVDQYGNAVSDATPVTFAANIGNPIPPASTSNGMATSAITSTLAGTAHITATSDSVSGSTIVIFTPGSPVTVTLNASPPSQTVGASSALTATVVDQYGNAVSDATPVTFAANIGNPIPPASTSNGMATSAITSTLAGTAHITATSVGRSGSASVVFNPGAPHTLMLQPPTAVISAGTKITYTASALDVYGNSIGDVTSGTTFSIAPAAGGSFAGNAVTPTVKNTWIVTGTIGTASDTATLIVTAAAFNRLSVENAPAGSGTEINTVTLTVYDTLSVYAAAYDVYNNLIGPRNVTWGGTGVVAGNLSPTTGLSTTFTPVIGGTGIITAVSNGITDTTGLITVQAPALQISKSADPSPATPGTQIEYTIVYTNAGNAPAQNASITETYPMSTSYVLAAPPPTSGTNIWELGSLGVGVTGTIVVDVNVPAQMPVGSVLTNSVQLGASRVSSAAFTITTTVNAIPDLTATVLDIPDPVRPGDLLNYFITYRNSGSAPVTNVRLTETYPSGVSFVSANPPPNVNNDVWLTSTLAGGNQQINTIAIIVRVHHPLNDLTILNNRVTIAADQSEPYLVAAQTLVTAPEVDLTMIADPLTPTAHSELTYTLHYTNSGSSYAANVSITDALPLNTSFGQCEPIGCTANNGIVTWNIGDVPQQSSDLVTLTVHIANNLLDGTRITNTARLASTDLVSATAVVTNTITSVPDVMVTNSNGVTTLAAGEVTTYGLGYSNLGTAPAQNVVITDRIPDNTAFVGCTACTPLGGGVYSFTLGTVKAAESSSVTVSVRVASPLPAGLRFITNTASITTTTPGDASVNNLAEDVDAIATRPTLGLSVAYDSSTPYPGKVITYTLRYTNTSAMNTTGVEITTTRSAFISGTPPGWTPLGGIDLYSIGALAAGQSGSITYLITLPPTFTVAMNAFTMTFLLQDNGPGGWPVAQAQVVPVIGVPDLSIERVIVPAAVVAGQKFTATVVVHNTGLGRACNPSNCGGFWIDAFVDPLVPPLSYPYKGDGNYFISTTALDAGEVITFNMSNIMYGINQDPVVYFKVDNFNCSPTNGADPCLPSHSLGGLVPESNEYNNVSDPIVLSSYQVYIPLVRKN